MKKLPIWCVIILLSLTLFGCGKCEHEYDNGVITKDSTCTEEGEKIFTCTLCEETKIESVANKAHTYNGEITKESTFDAEGEKTFTCKYCEDSYVESLPVRDDEVIVTVTDKKNVALNTNEGRFSDRVEFYFEVTNRTDKTIKGIQGNLTFLDLFGKEILTIHCDFTGDKITANSALLIDGLGMDINEFMDDHVKLYSTDFDDLQFEYEVTNIVYDDGSSMKESSNVDKVENENVKVNAIDKQILDINFDAGRFSPRAEFSFEIFNNTSKDIKGIEGVLTIKDLFGKDIMSVQLDFTGQTISANGSDVFTGLGMDINEFMDDHVKLYSTDFDDLQFEYEVTSIVYTDGTTE